MGGTSGDEVILLFGGTSTERFVSVASAQNLCVVLPAATLWFIAPNGSVQRAERSALLAHHRPFELDFLPEAPPFAPNLLTALSGASKQVFFIGLHGGEGENGTLQLVLEQRQIAFTGSGSLASALAFDKVGAKRIVEACGARVAIGEVLTGGEQAVHETLRRLFAAHGRLVAKPVADGSSIGIHHLTRESELAEAAREIAASGVSYLAERFVSGRELTVGVIERDGRSVSLPPSEVAMEAGRAFDYAGKYLGQGSRETTPADLDFDTERQARELARTAHDALGCRGYSRTDMIVDEGGITYLETNTLPGLTKASFLPQQLAASGETLARFVEQQLALARLRAAQARAAPAFGR